MTSSRETPLKRCSPNHVVRCWFLTFFECIRNCCKNAALQQGRLERAYSSDRAAKDQCMHVMGAFVGVDRFQIEHVADDLIFA